MPVMGPQCKTRNRVDRSITAQWPDPQAEIDAAAKAEIDWLIALTSAVRTAKNELGIPPGAKLEAFCPAPSALAKSVVEANGAAIERLARLTPIHFTEAPGGAAMQIAAGEDALVIPLEGVIDIEAMMASNLPAWSAGMMPSQSCVTNSHSAFISSQSALAISMSKPSSLPSEVRLLKGG